MSDTQSDGDIPEGLRRPGRDAFATMDEGPVRTDMTKPRNAGAEQVRPNGVLLTAAGVRVRGLEPETLVDDGKIKITLRTKTQAEIDAEKAGKPRPDLLPARALAFAFRESHPFVADAFDALAAHQRTRDLEALGTALECVLDEACATALAEDRAGVLRLAGEIMGVGLRKHGPGTWRVAGTDQADPQTHYAGAVRHMLEHCAGVAADPDSRRPPLLHAVCQLSILINLLDDPPSTPGVNDGRAMIGGST